MLYLNNTIITQTVKIPRIDRTLGAPYTLTLNRGAWATASITATCQSYDQLYITVSITLPSGLSDGDYTYTLISDGIVISKGLINLQSAELEIKEHNVSETIKEYQSE